MSREIVSGPGYAVGDLELMGEGYGFRKIRRGLDVKELGVNAIVMPPGFETSGHYHDEQEELYFVHRGTIAITFGDGTTHELGPGGLARVDAPTVRSIKNVGEGDAVYVIVGAKGGYVGRDGRLPDGTTSRVAPGAA
jgi:quercetin dioxygenase-like cupin family protein